MADSSASAKAMARTAPPCAACRTNRPYRTNRFGKWVDEVVDKVVGKVVGRSNDPIYHHHTRWLL